MKDYIKILGTDLRKKLEYELIEDNKSYLRYANYFNNKKYIGGEMVDFDKKIKDLDLQEKVLKATRILNMELLKNYKP